MRCRICKGERWEFVLATPDLRFAPDDAEYEIVRCRDCGVLATSARGEFVDPAGHYPADYGAFAGPAAGAARLASTARRHLPGLHHVALHRFAWLADLPPGGPRRVLEVGCGSGKVALALRDAQGWEAVGIEPDAAAAQAARDRGLETHTGSLDDFPGGENFDAVLFVHVLEHLEDPLSALRNARARLVEGGFVVVALPNVAGLERRLFGRSWDGWDVPRHVHHFAPAVLCRLLERAGFAPGRVRHEWYSLLARSAGNHWRADRPHGERGSHRLLRLLEAPWGLGLALCRSSSALQVVARAV